MKSFLVLFAVSLIAFSICFNFFTEFGHFSNSNDYLFHFNRSQGECFYPEHYAHSCVGYPPVFNWLADLFSFNEFSFFVFIFLIIFGLIPVLLFLVARNEWVVPFYLAVSAPFNFLYAGIFPQALILCYFLGYLYLRQFNKPFLGFFLVLLAFFTHQYGFFFMVLIFFLDHLFKLKPYAGVLVLQTVNFSERFLDSMLKFPLIFGLIGLKQLLKEKNWFLLMVVLLTFFGAFLDLRVLLFSQVALIIPASRFMGSSRKSFKALMVVYLLAYYVFNLIYWVYFSQLNLFLYI